MKLVLVLCAICLMGASAVYVMQQQGPTRVRVPADVAHALELSPEAEIDPEPLELPTRVATETVIAQPEWTGAQPEGAAREDAVVEPLSDEIAAVLRDRGLEVRVPAMVLYSGAQLNEALECFEGGMQELVASHSNADGLQHAIQARRDLGWSEVEIESDISDWSLSATAYLTVAANLGRIAEDLRGAFGNGESGAAGRVQLHASVRQRIHDDSISSAATFASSQPDFSVQFQKRQWHFVLTVPYTFLTDSEQQAIRAALERRRRAADAARDLRDRRATGGVESGATESGEKR